MDCGRAGVRLVLDWDGTVTERGSFGLVITRYGDIATYALSRAARVR